MHIAITKPLFAWDCLEDSPSLSTIKRFLETVPDGRLLEGLRRHRGRGRNDYPIHVLWGVLLLRIALRHVSVEATLGELSRNEHLRRLIGIERESGVPKAWNVSRFLEVLGREPHVSELRRIFNGLVRPLGAAVPDLGKDTAGDSTALHARAKDEKAAAAEIAEGLPQPSGGKKEYLDDDGKVTKIVEWFGYKLHLLVDAKHEVALAYEVTTANAADSKSLPSLVEQAQANLPEGRIETLAYDKAADDNESHRRLNRAGIRPVIQNRRLWKDQTEQMLPGHDGRSNVVYDEAGTLHCYDRTSQPIVRHRWPTSATSRSARRSSTDARRGTRAGTVRTTPCATRAKSTAKPSASTARSTCGDSRPSLGPPRSSSGSTTVARRSSESTPG
jgi:hypothetical protein